MVILVGFGSIGHFSAHSDVRLRQPSLAKDYVLLGADHQSLARRSRTYLRLVRQVSKRVCSSSSLAGTKSII
jgi:hypothetical protein